MGPLRVLVDARCLAETATSNLTYWKSLLLALTKLPEFRPWGSEQADGFQLVLASDTPLCLPDGLQGVCQPVYKPSLSGRIWSLVTLPKLARAHGAHVAHVQYAVSPLFRTPVVTTIHDLSAFVPGSGLPPRDAALLRLVLPSSAKKARQVIAPSQATQEDIVRHLGVPPGKVTVTLLGPSFEMDPVDPDQNFDTSAFRQFALLVGGATRRKNWRMAMEVVEACRRRGAPELCLVVTGPLGDLSLQEAASTRPWFHYLGPVPDAVLRTLYARASVLLHPSKYEGFGLTALDAMREGLPVVVSDAGSLPEVVGEAGAVLPLANQSGWEDAVLAALRGGQARDLAVRQAARFSWMVTARQTLQTYARAAGLQDQFGKVQPVTGTENPTTVSPELLEILACPRCEERPPLRQEGDRLVCTVCGCSYPVVDGIPHLLPEDAREPSN